VLNLDAELELETGVRYTPSAAMTTATSAASERLRAMLPPDDVVLDVDPESSARGRMGRCFCPTVSALRRLERAGAQIPEAPSMEVLARVNERGFALAIGHLEGALRCADEDAVARALAREGRWLLKRGLGFAGRGQRRIDSGEISEADRAWIRASLRKGALYVEPRVAITLEVALHGLLATDGSCERGEPTVQEVVSGAWRASWRARPGELGDPERAALSASFDEVSAALRSAGYFGPFGIDAFRFTEDGAERFQPLSEINARYTMAWGTGMGRW
jgi:hypothetical protein